MTVRKITCYCDFYDLSNSLLSQIKVYGTEKECVSFAYMLWAYRDLLCFGHCDTLKVTRPIRKNNAQATRVLVEINE